MEGKAERESQVHNQMKNLNDICEQLEGNQKEIISRLSLILRDESIKEKAEKDMEKVEPVLVPLAADMKRIWKMLVNLRESQFDIINRLEV